MFGCRHHWCTMYESVQTSNMIAIFLFFVSFPTDYHFIQFSLVRWCTLFVCTPSLLPACQICIIVVIFFEEVAALFVQLLLVLSSSFCDFVRADQFTFQFHLHLSPLFESVPFSHVLTVYTNEWEANHENDTSILFCSALVSRNLLTRSSVSLIISCIYISVEYKQTK